MTKSVVSGVVTSAAVLYLAAAASMWIPSVHLRPVAFSLLCLALAAWAHHLSHRLSRRAAIAVLCGGACLAAVGTAFEMAVFFLGLAGNAPFGNLAPLVCGGLGLVTYFAAEGCFKRAMETIDGREG